MRRPSEYAPGERLRIYHQDLVHEAWARNETFASYGVRSFRTLCGLSTWLSDEPPSDTVTCFNCILKGP